ncbi:GNAT family N-acetyltransferase [Fusibacter sp. JL298sf-3]
MKTINYENYYWQNDLVRLRAMQPEDWEEHYYNCFDSEARRMLQYELELPPTISDNKSEIEGFSNFNAESRRLMFTIETLDGTNVGSFNLNGIDERNGTFGIGIQIGRDYRGKGYGTSAMRLLLNYAFNERRLNKFNVSVIEGNIGSATMLEKLGCKQEGIRREVIFTDGVYKDEIFYGLTRKEFNA